jgi:hypothetical protein
MQEANAEQKEEDGSRDDATIHRGLLPASKHSRTYAKLLRRWLGHAYAVMMRNTKNRAATSSEFHVTLRMYVRYDECARLANDTLQSQIFHCVEDLVMQHVDVRSSAPVIQRVIAIDCPSQVYNRPRPLYVMR